MTKVSKKSSYPLKYPVSKDYFVGTDSENNLKTVNFGFEETANLVNKLNGTLIVNYLFKVDYNISLAVLTEGVFCSEGNETSVSQISKLYVNKKNFSDDDLTTFFTFIKDNNQNFVFKLQNSEALENACYFNISSIENHTDYFIFNINISLQNQALLHLVHFNVYFFSFELKPIDLAITTPEFNKITSQTGFSLLSQDLTINSNWTWKILNVDYSNISDIVINIPFCSTGKSRIDYIVPNNTNGFIRVSGVESITIPIAPAITNDNMYVTFFIVTDGSIGDLSSPIIGNLYIPKLEKVPVVLQQTGVLDFVIMNLVQSHIRITVSVIKLRSLYHPTNNTFLYEGRKLTISNDQSIDCIIENMASGTGASNHTFHFPNDTDFVIKPKQTIEFYLRITTTGHGVYEYIGIITPENSEYDNLFIYTTGAQTFTIPSTLKIMNVTLNDGRVLKKTTEWTRTSTTEITIIYALEINDTIYITGLN